MHLALLLLAACGEEEDTFYYYSDSDAPIDSSADGVDADGDGFARSEGGATVDCDDRNADIHPGADEVCDHQDNDCDGYIDDADDSVDPAGQSLFYADADADGYGDDEAGTVTACDPPEGYLDDDTDCDDYSDDVNPGVDEICDGKDNDCDGVTDDDDTSLDLSTASYYYADFDGDGYGSDNSATIACAAPDGYVSDNTDCDDLNESTYPGAAEVCDGADNDCDKIIDDNCS